MRYAIYFTPPRGSALARLGAAWLGRDAFSGAAVAQPVVDGIEPGALAALTADPRRYGFHGTLKAPFALAGGMDEAGLLEATERFAAATVAFDAGPLVVADLRGFLALVPAGPVPALGGFAAACVAAFEPFRAPLTEAQVARRIAGGLTPRQEAALRRWGYPYVFEDFAFHMTLTQRLDAAGAARLLDAAAAHFAGETASLRIGELAIFAEPAPGAPFHVAASFPLAAGAAITTA